jgi:rhodanese-related sulfurtransferase
MPTPVQFVPIERVLELITNEEDAKIVEVLAPDEYAKGHLPPAINIPTELIGSEAARQLPDKNQIIVVYCGSFKCGASTQAARMLTELGYTRVEDYKGGKKDWEARGMPLVK